MLDNEKPIIEDSQTFEYLPDQSAGFVIGKISASDDVAITGFSEFAGDPYNYFSIDTEGNISLTEEGAKATAASNSLDIGTNTWTLKVRAFDAASNLSNFVDVDISLRDLTDNESAAVVFRDMADGLYTATRIITLARLPLKPIKYKFKSVEKLEANIQKMEDKLWAANKLSGVLEKWGPLKVVFKAFGLTTEKAAVNLRKANFKLEVVSEKSAKIGQIVETIDFGLKVNQKALGTIAFAAEALSEKLASAQQNLKSAGNLIPLPVGVDFLLGTEEGGPILPGGGGAAQAALSTDASPTPLAATGDITFDLSELPISIDAAKFGARLARMDVQSQDQFDEMAAAAKVISDKVKVIGDELQSIVDAVVNNDVFKTLDDFNNLVNAALKAISPVFSPLEKVADALGPVLDALGSIFGFLLKPLEYILDAVIEATGIKSVIEALANELVKLLPDFGILDTIIAKIEKDFIIDFPKNILEKVTEPLQEILDELNGPDFPMGSAIGDEYNNTLTGSLTSIGALTLDGKGGDDNLFGGKYDDTLIGGTGSDFLSGGGGNDVLDGGSNESVTVMVPSKLNPLVLVEQEVHEPDFVIYEGSRDDYAIVGEIGSDGRPTGRWVIADNRSDAQIAASGSGVNNGIDQLFGIEIVFWDDAFLDLTAFDTFIETKSLDGEAVFVSPTGSSLPNVPDPADPGGPGIEVKTGELANDYVIGDIGVDFIETGGGNDQLDSSTNGPGSRVFSVGDILFGGADNDVYVADTDTARWDHIVDSEGIDTLDLSDHRGAQIGVASNGDPIYEDIPLHVFLGSTENEEFYRPVTIDIDVDTIGRAVNPDTGLFSFDFYNAGVARGIENIIGTRFDDVFYGTNDVNVLNGGDGDDQIRGLGGDDVLLGGDGDDSLIGDGGDDYLDGGSGSNVYIGGLGNDEIVDLSSSFSFVKYSAYASTDHYSHDVDFVDFHITGFGTYDIYDMPGAVYIYETELGNEQIVGKFIENIDVDELIGVDTLTGIERIVATTGNDVVFSASGINQQIWGNDGDDFLASTGGDTANTFYGGPGDDEFASNTFSEDRFFGGSGSDTIYVEDDTTVEGDLFFGDDNRQAPLEGIDVLDLSTSIFSWHVYMNPRAPNGVLAGLDPLSAVDVEDPLYIQPTLGVHDTMPKLPGVSVFGEVYESVVVDLRVPDPNANEPGGRADGFGEFEVILGSENRDFLVGGNPDFEMSLWGNGGDDVLYAGQRFAATLYGGEGNDVLGTYNDTYGSEQTTNWYDESKLTQMFGEAGNDSFVAGDFRELFSGGTGVDHLTYEVSKEAVAVDLLTLSLDGGYATGDILIGGIEKVTGSEFDDILFGDDEVNELVGWDGADVIRGKGGSDVLFGNDGNDLLYGGEGNDLLHGGNGGDLLNGGEGMDTASYNLFQVHPKGGLDRITGDVDGVTVDLQAADVNGEIIVGEDILVSIENLKGSTGDDNFFGDDGENLLAGNLGHDLLDGRGGNDLLIGGEGDDTLIGGAGEDFLIGGAGTNVLDGGADIDTVDYGVLDRGIVVTMAGVGSRVGFDTGEVDYFTRIDKYVWSDSLPLERDENTPWQELLAAGTSEERFTYQIFDRGTDDPSDDLISIEESVTPDRIWYLNPTFARSESDLESVRFLSRDNLMPTSVSPNLDDVVSKQVTVIDDFVIAADLIKDIERIVGSQGDDTILGNAEDTFFYGGRGADTIDGGEGVDTASYEHSGFLELEDAAGHGVTIDLQNQIFSGGEAEGDVLMNIENVIGSAFDDVLSGDAQDNRLTLGTGNNVATGGDGLDTVVFAYASTDLIVQELLDTLRIVRNDDEIILSDDRVGKDVEFFEFTDQTLTLAQMLGLVVTGTEGDDLLIGTPIDDNLLGRGGDDVIEGRESGDVLDGGADNDLLKGEGGDDSLIGGTGEDRFIGGLGDDTFVVDRTDEIITELFGEGTDTVETTVDFELPDHVENLLLLGTGPLTGTGNDLDNVITGNDQNEALLGKGGADTLDGGTGVNTLIGGDGADQYLINQQGDTIVEAEMEGYDTIITTVDASLPSNVEQIVVKGGGDLTLTGNDQENTFADGLSIIQATDDPLDGMGNSTFDGGGGEDIALFKYDFATSVIGMDSDGFLTITNGTQTDRIKNIEKIDFADQFLLYEDLLLAAFPPQDVQVYAGDYFVSTTAIDMSPEGGGTQFIFAGDTDSGNNEDDEYHYSVSFGGKAEFRGQDLDAQDDADGTVNSISVDFNGGNTTRLSVGGFEKTLEEMKNADWNFWQTAIFGGDDTITGSYLSDKLVGYTGDDIIFGGLGDKVRYDLNNPPSSKPSNLRDPGAIVDAAFFEFDGNDVIEGLGGNDTLDGGTGNDIVLGGVGNDVLFGGGGDYADSLFGGEGDDTLTGGEGGDIFVLALGMGRETVTDFEVGVDTIDFSSLSPSEFAQIVIDNSDPGVTVIQLSDGSQMILLDVMLTELPLPILTVDGLDGFNGTRLDLGEAITNLSAAGDVNGDGIDDFLVGWHGTSTITPITYLVYGQEGGFGPSLQPFMLGIEGGTSFMSATAEGYLGVSSAGDFNGDGIDDLVFIDRTQSHIVFGKEGGFTESYDLAALAPGEGITLDFGANYETDDENVIGGLDLNDDGFDDVVIADSDGFGAVRVIYGTDTAPNMITEADLDGTAGVVMTASDHDFSYTGNSLSSAGDVNGDGIEDLIIGARFKEVVNQNDMTQTEWTGGGYVVFGSATGFAPLVDLGTLTADQGTEIFGNFDTGQGRTGYTVTGGGDVNGDGVDDLGLSRNWIFTNNDPEDLHAASIIYGQAGGLGADFQMSEIDGIDGSSGTVFTFDLPENTRTPYVGEPAFEGNPAYDTIVNHLGSSRIEIVGDLNNDRIADVVVSTSISARTIFYTYNADRGRMESDSSYSFTGKTYVVYGTKDGFGAEVDLDLLAAGQGYVVDTGAGTSGGVPQITSVGDVNGDGSNDLLLNDLDGNGLLLYSAPYSNNPVTGEVLIFGLAAEDEVLTSDVLTIADIDGGTDNLMYQWLRDGAPITENGTGETYTLGDADVGAVVSLQVSFIDGEGNLEVVTSAATLAVTNTNDIPVANDDDTSGNEDTVFKINVLGNDTDDDGDQLTITDVTQGTNGVVAINDDGTISYTPDAEFSGTDNFTYTVSDGNGASDMANVTLTINAVNDLPVTMPDAVTLDEEATTTVEVLSNDTDIDSTSISVTDPVGLAQTSANGKATVTHLGNGVFEVTGTENAFGIDSFDYTVEDSDGGSTTGTIDITLDPTPDAPTPQDDQFFEPEDSVLHFDVLANDTDPDGDALTIVSVTGGTATLAVITVDQQIRVIPVADTVGVQIITYTVRDTTGLESTAELEIRYLPFNDAPIAVDDEITIDEDIVTDIMVLANDTDVDDAELTIESFPTDTDRGTLEDIGNGILRYTPDTNYNGADSFTYTVRDAAGLTSSATVSITINPVNDAPVARPDSFTGVEDTPITVNVTNNDFDVDSAGFSVVGTISNSFASSQFNEDGTITVTPYSDFEEQVTVFYTIEDTEGLRSEGEFTVDFTPVNDAPRPVDDELIGLEGLSHEIFVLENDEDVDFDTGDFFIDTFTQGTFGVVENLSESLLYTPFDLNFFGTDSFTYTVVDSEGLTATATVNVEITNVNDAPVVMNSSAQLTEDTILTGDVSGSAFDVENDTLVFGVSTQALNGEVVMATDGSFTYTPNKDADGLDQFEFSVFDGTDTTFGLFDIEMIPVNDAPNAVDDTIDLFEDQGVVFNPFTNDSDVDSFSWQLFSDTFDGPGVLFYSDIVNMNYLPEADFHGTVSFTYTLIDDQFLTSTATITLNVMEVNDAPVAMDDDITVSENTPITFDPRENDFDVDLDTMIIESVTTASNGEAVLNDDGTVTYTPTLGYRGTDSITYTINDGRGETATATISIDVIERNDAPVAVDDVVSTDEDIAITFAPMANDTDREDDTFEIVSITQPDNGTLTDNEDGTLTYTPPANANGTGLETASYTIEDGFGRKTTGQITFNVAAVNDPTLGELLMSVGGVVDVVSDFTVITPVFSVDTSGLSDGDGLKIEGGLFSGIVPGSLVWRLDGVQVSTDREYIPADQEAGLVTVEAIFIDNDGNETFKKSAGEELLAASRPVQRGRENEQDIFIDIGASDDGGEIRLIEEFDPSEDILDLRNREREIGLNAYNNVEEGSVILTFDNGDVFYITGDGVSPDTLTKDNFIFAEGNIDATGSVEVTGVAEQGNTLQATLVDIEDLDGIKIETAGFQWQRNSVDITGATNAAYTLVAADAGNTIQVVYSFLDDFDNAESLTSAETVPVVGNDIPGVVRVGTNNAEVLTGEGGNDTITGLDGNDTLEGGGGDDVLDGGEGRDLALFGGEQASYTLTISPTETLITSRASPNANGTDTLNSIEFLDFETNTPLFEGRLINLDNLDGPAGLTADEFGAIIELYIAYFNRAPDAIGLNYWGTQFANGRTLVKMSEQFFRSSEARETYDSVLDDEFQLDITDPVKVDSFVTQVYANVLGREADPGGFAYWTNQLETSSKLTPGKFILAIIKGAKFPGNPTDQTAADQAYLATKADLGTYFAVIKGMSDIDDARDAMSFYTGTPESVTETLAVIDGHYADALDPETGDFLMQLVGVIDDPFAMI